jgi:hemoglobin
MLDPTPSLYERLGSYDGIAAIVDDLLPRLLGDRHLGVYWKGKCKDSLKKDRQLIVDFLGSAFGGPVVYLGRDMKTSHNGLGITEDEWNRFIEHVVATLKNLAIPERESTEFLAAAGSLKADVVESSHGDVRKASRGATITDGTGA